MSKRDLTITFDVNASELGINHVRVGSVISGPLLNEIPIVPDIDQAILKAIERPGCSLDMEDWHSCGTTHCRAGWAIHLAGDAGYALEKRFSPEVAGALIYAASGSIPTPDFFVTNEEALADMRARATRAEAQAAEGMEE